jgi:hypothetical protein
MRQRLLPSLVISNACLRRIASVRPRLLMELDKTTCAGMSASTLAKTMCPWTPTGMSVVRQDVYGASCQPRKTEVGTGSAQARAIRSNLLLWRICSGPPHLSSPRLTIRPALLDKRMLPNRAVFPCHQLTWLPQSLRRRLTIRMRLTKSMLHDPSSTRSGQASSIAPTTCPA